MVAKRPIAPLPRHIAGIGVPQDAVSSTTWHWVQRVLPRYLLAHSVRSFCWGVTIAAGEGWSFDRQVLWTASLLHDQALTSIPRNRSCFEVEGAEIARRFLERHAMPPAVADRVATAIVLHMQPEVTLADGVEAVLLDQATGLDVRGDGFELVEAVRPAVVQAFPRGAFDRHFLAAFRHEAALRPTCQSARLLHETDLAGWMARSAWAAAHD
ncbi:MAG TPA: HD domain-containing protein [Candidatus Sulfotelmatobacter sp.]|nr:HD domain-containing protein [Candidatus Sulfotelmatobacter sp.]